MTSPPRKSRRWYHWLTQYSLRTLLILVTLSAVACWWFLQPTTKYEDLAGEHLKLRRQVRFAKDAKPPDPFAGELVNAGFWRMYDRFDGLIADGRYENDQPHGKWTLYHPSGRKAAEGTMTHGLRTGLWKVWDARGQPVSEVTYAIGVSMPRRVPEPRGFPYPYTTIPVVGMTNFLAPSVPLAWQGGGFGYNGMGMSYRSYYRARYENQPQSIRHGPCRAWHPTGKLWFTGQYDSDERVGEWSFFDEQGTFAERGSFDRDRREGPWTIADSATGMQRIVEYVDDRPSDEFEQWLVEIRSDLASGAVRQELAAIGRLEELGPRGRPLLVELLEHQSARLQLLALRTLARQGALPDDALPRIAALIDHSHPRLSLRAMLAVYLAAPSKRPDVFSRLLAAMDDTDDRTAFEALLAIYRADENNQALVLASLLKLMVYPGFAPDTVARVADLGDGILPQLTSLYPTLSPDERWFALLITHDLVARGEPTYVEIKPGVQEARWEIPAAAQPLIDRAKADADPRVRDAAENVGRGMGGGFGFSGSVF